MLSCYRRAFLLQAVRDAWASLVAGGEPTERELARLSLANVHAVESAVQAVELMYKAAGGSAVYSRSALDRCMRDVHVAAQHIGVSAQHYQSILPRDASSTWSSSSVCSARCCAATLTSSPRTSSCASSSPS